MVLFKCIMFLHIVPFTMSTLNGLPALLPLRTAPACPRPQTGQVSLKCVWGWRQSRRHHLCRERQSVHEKSPSSQDSNSLSLLTEISGVEAPVPLCSVSVLQSLASGLPRRGEVGSKWGWWRRSWRESLGELSEGRREGSCCSLDKDRKMRVTNWSFIRTFKRLLFSHRQSKRIKSLFTYLFFAEAARSLWRRFLNQLPTCVGVRPVAWAKCRFLDGLG